MKEIKTAIKAEEIITLLEEGRNAKAEINKEGEAWIMPLEAYGYDETILTQTFEAYDFEELEKDKESYIEWLKDCYSNEELEAEDGEYQITIEIK